MSDTEKAPEEIVRVANVRPYDPMRESRKALFYFLAAIVILYFIVRP